MNDASTSYQWSALRPPPCHSLSGFYLSTAGWLVCIIMGCAAVRLVIFAAEILAQ